MPTVKVTLDQSTTPWTLQVDADPVVMGRNAKAQPIHWHLSGNAYAGEFLDPSGSKKGFSWENNPPDGVFDAASRSPKKKALTLQDKNFNAGSKGEWEYALRMKLDGTVYTTAGASKTLGGGGSPTIKNN